MKKGEVIGIVAPAWSFDRDNFKKGVEKLRKLGFRVRYDRSIFSKYWSLAGYDRQRAEQINRMFADPEVKAIFCAKAGYGSIRTIPYLDLRTIRSNPKIFVGYSDITFLLSYLYTVAEMVVFHGPVVADEIKEEMNPATLNFLLQAITLPLPLGELKFENVRSLRPGRASGTLIGGNMSLIISAIGTPYELNTDNKILFLEDIGEALEVIDNYLMHLKLAGKFRKIKGIVFGRMIDCIDFSQKSYTIRDILHDILEDVDVPIIYGFPSGHRVAGAVNVTLPFGVSVTVDANRRKLIVHEAGVS
ncbi:LD-carboxypeptidase [Candidatus Omnitrophota bacterium]